MCRGVGAGCNTKEVLERLRDLRAEVEDLDLKERELDQQKSWLQQNIRNVMDDTVNSRYPFPWLHVTSLGRGKYGAGPAISKLCLMSSQPGVGALFTVFRDLSLGVNVTFPFYVSNNLNVLPF